MTNPLWKYAMLASKLEGYSQGLPDYCEAEKAMTKEAAALLNEVYEEKMKASEQWKINNDQA